MKTEARQVIEGSMDRGTESILVTHKPIINRGEHPTSIINRGEYPTSIIPTVTYRTIPILDPPSYQIPYLLSATDRRNANNRPTRHNTEHGRYL